jgi:hypothetical protein
MSLEVTPLLGSLGQNSAIEIQQNNGNLTKEQNHTSETISSDNASINSNHRNEIAHSIGMFGSLALIMNNLTGPAMMGFPHLFQQAGILPVTFGIIFVCLCSSLCGTFLADTISSIPNNSSFERHIDFSTAFKLTVGDDWYLIAETLFLISCAVQACAAIVESAQSVDGFIASFVFGKTYALQLAPQLAIVSWSTVSCHSGDAFQEESALEECIPFHDAGPLILSLGFVVTTMIFLPLGQGHLQETIAVQIFSFIFMILLLIQFSFEFYQRGFQYNVPWIGDDMSQLAGVVLFNFAFSITVPSWLCEKHPSVSVNRTIWTSTTFASILYIGFGWLGAMSFDDVSANMLVLLTSSKVHLLTRVCAALFGVTIIGCGVPVFCVIIKNALDFNGICSPTWALFW